MKKGNYGIFNNVSNPNIIIRPEPKKQRQKIKTPIISDEMVFLHNKLY